MPIAPAPTELERLTIASTMPSALKPSAKIPAAITRATTPDMALPMDMRNAFSPAPNFSMLPRQRTASQIIAIATQKNMRVVMSSLMESMQ